MSNFFQSVRQGFGRQSNRTVGNGQQRTNGSAAPSPTTPFSPTSPPLPGSQENVQQMTPQPEPEPIKFFFKEKYARLGVKGNFMPLAAQPTNVDLGEWLAHQSVEQYRVVEQLIGCIQEVDSETGEPICNSKVCPVMSAGRRHTYTWLNNMKEPVKVPAEQYIKLVQRWIVGKLSDPRVFPTDSPTSNPATYASGGLNTPGATSPIAAGPTALNASLSTLAGREWVGKNAGFPESFFNDCKTIFRQLFRVYAHLYHAHWIDPFWHMTDGSLAHGWTDLNSCFVHFITVSKLFGLLTEKDLEPMQPLIDIWISNGSIPPDAAAGACTIVPAQ